MPGRILLDTSILVDLLRGDETLRVRISEAQGLCTSAIAVGELLYGVQYSAKKELNQRKVEGLSSEIEVFPCDDFKELRERMSPERREATRERAAAMLLAMDLVGLRGKVELTQEELAERLAISQSNVSRLERRRDMLVSTLREVVEAMGGELHLVAEFPDGSVEITQFEDEEAA